MTGLTATIMLAAGGTGGHMFPAEALARELLARGHRVVLVTDRRGKAFGEALPEIAVHRIRASTLGSGLLNKLRGTIELGLGTMQARGLIARLRPDIVVGFGGYPSVPTVFAAQRSAIPVVLHEQNAVLGRANRMLAGRASRIATSFTDVASVRLEDRARLVRTGNPVRPAFAAVRGLPYPALTPDGPVHLLVLGGSQGARVFSEVVPQALGQLPDALRNRLSVTQQCRPEDLDAARTAFARAGVAAKLAAFFTDVPDRVASCHLAICRAGASTVAELTVAGRPAILVPYPYATDDHQTANARAMADAGGAWLMPQPSFTSEALAARLEALLTLPATLPKAAAAAHAWGTVDAAARLADTVLALAAADGAVTRGSPVNEAAE
jgi:UDP-N-acetylglucosamine--N-acetylmuramyl-(pentapeptide) pyrophosphoryl-undecaprenol N-acetylglucosamine transferase